jgi:hypothetical protein
VSRQGGQMRRLGELVLGALTATRAELRHAATGDEEAIEEVRERGAEVLADVQGRAHRIARADGRSVAAGSPPRVLNAGYRPAGGSSPSASGPVIEAEFVEEERAPAERARSTDR